MRMARLAEPLMDRLSLFERHFLGHQRPDFPARDEVERRAQHATERGVLLDEDRRHRRIAQRDGRVRSGRR